MFNIFDNVQMYGGKWSVKESRPFNETEKKSIKSAVVVDSEYGNSVCFTMVSGMKSFIPLSSDSTAGLGEAIDVNNVNLLTLSKPGEADIMRIEAK